MDTQETEVAESSPTVETPAVEPTKSHVDPLQEGPMVTWTREQRDNFKLTGKVPGAEPKADSAPAKKESEAEAESAAASEAANKQENTDSHSSRKPKQTAEERIEQLEKTIEKIRKGAGLERAQQHTEPPTEKPDSKTEEHPAQPKNYHEWRKAFKPSQWIEDYAKSNPEASYEDATAAMADYLGDVRDNFKSREAQEQAIQRELAAKVSDAKTRYPNYDEVIDPAIDAILGDKDVTGVVKSMLNESEVLPDLMFTIGSKPEELEHFLKMAKQEPGKALRYIALTESLIREELENSKSGSAAKVETSPAKPQTQAPKPPAEVGGRGAAPPDALVSAAQANDFRAFKAEINRRSLARLKAS